MVTVTTADIEAVWRPLSTAEAGTLTGKSADAWARLVARRPSLEKDIEDEVVSEAAVKSAMTSMIIRVFKNPDSARQISKAVDDWSKSLTLDSTISSGEMYVNEYEAGLISPATIAPVYGAYVVGLGG